MVVFPSFRGLPDIPTTYILSQPLYFEFYHCLIAELMDQQISNITLIQ